jgi:hypothetical protein
MKCFNNAKVRFFDDLLNADVDLLSGPKQSIAGCDLINYDDKDEYIIDNEI